MVKRTKLRYTIQRKNGDWYFRRGRVWRKLPGDPGTDAEAAALYWRCRSGQERPPRAQSVAELIKSYRKSPGYLSLARRTKADYETRLRYVEASAGGVMVAALRRADIIEARDRNANRPGFANNLIATLSLLMEHAIDLDWRRDNPARGVKRLPGGAGHEPWTPTEIANYRAHATGAARTAFELCLGTGQRIGDVLAMRWDDIDDGGINLVQQKTGTALWIPFTPDLAAYLDALPRGLRTTIITIRRGTPMGYRHLHKLVERAKAEAGVEGKTLHGLRYNAASELFEAGCSEAEVMAITGHRTPSMAHKYGKGARQRKLAKQARGRGAE